MHKAKADIAIFGGGIAGLWALARLRAAGFSAVLFESGSLGGVQTIASQGIIHGGTKYALTGNLTESARAIGNMPGVWRSCLEGKGELDLSRVRVLSENQYLWSSSSLVSRMAGFFASKAMRSRMTEIPFEERPEPFRHQNFSGALYRLEEQVLDVGSLVTELQRQLGEYCYKVDMQDLEIQPRADAGHCVSFPGQGVELEVQRLLFTAGKGNQELLQAVGMKTPAMQLRPLHMVVVKGELPPVFAHCLGSGSTPRITITSCEAPDGRMAWYMGGELSESGVSRTSEQQLVYARRELEELLPWVDLAGLEWSSLFIDRAEPKMPGGKRPDSVFVQSDQGVMTAWPTKLAFAPYLAGEILKQIQRENLQPQSSDLAAMKELSRPGLAQAPWEIMTDES